MGGLRVSYQWRSAVTQKNGDAYEFPNKFTFFFRQTYSVPAVYRWRVMKNVSTEKESIYIGEAEELPRRIQRVRTPSKKAKDTDTNKRLHQHFEKFISEGRKIVIEVADVDPFELNGVRFGRDTMGDRFKRRATENILLALAQAEGEFEILNIVIDPMEKARQSLQALSLRQLREIQKKYGLDQTK